MVHGIIDDLCKTLSELRKKLRSAGFANAEMWVSLRGSAATFLMGKFGNKNVNIVGE